MPGVSGPMAGVSGCYSAGTPGAPARASSSDLGVVATRRGRALGSEARRRLEFAGGIGVLTVLREESAWDGIR